MGRKKQYRRDEVLMVAMNTFWERGFYATSMADLIAATGLNKNTLYSEFGSKDALFLAVIKLYTAMGIMHAESFLNKDPCGLDNIRDYFRSMTYEPNCRGCLMTMSINQKQLISEESLSVVKNALSKIEQLLLKNLNAACDAGIIANEKDGQRLATFLLFSIQGITTMGKLEGNQQKLDMVIKTILDLLNSFEQVP